MAYIDAVAVAANAGPWGARARRFEGRARFADRRLSQARPHLSGRTARLGAAGGFAIVAAMYLAAALWRALQARNIAAQH